jgi:hypothetical protein
MQSIYVGIVYKTTTALGAIRSDDHDLSNLESKPDGIVYPNKTKNKLFIGWLIL